jgi:hypothetical protein
VREYARPDQFVTTCIAYDRPALADDDLVRRLDVTAGNPYYAMQDGLLHPQTGSARQNWTTRGTWALYLSADRMYSSQQAPFLVTETNALSQSDLEPARSTREWVQGTRGQAVNLRRIASGLRSMPAAQVHGAGLQVRGCGRAVTLAPIEPLPTCLSGPAQTIVDAASDRRARVVPVLTRPGKAS